MTSRSMIRELTNKDADKLGRFLSGLSPEVFDVWNRFGFSIDDFSPKETAFKQCNLVASREKGFVALNKDREIIAYSYLRFFPEKKTKSHNASLGIVVASEYQGKGLGSRLMQYIHSWARKKGIKKIWLATYARNKAALHIYRELGYQVEGLFMYDECGKHGWDHVVSMALMLDEEFKNADKERGFVVDELMKGQRV